MKSFYSLCFFMILNGVMGQASLFEKQVDFQSQTLLVDASLAKSIKIKKTVTNTLKVKVSYEINGGENNDVVDVDLKSSGSLLKLLIKVDENEIKDLNGNDGDCNCNCDCWNYGKRNPICAKIEVSIEIPVGSDIQVESAIADISVYGLYGNFELNTATGKIELVWPEDVGAEIGFKTANGDIYTDSDFIKTTEKGLPLISGHKFTTKLGDGSYQVKLESTVGEIHFKTIK